jgi:hypothetical protein
MYLEKFKSINILTLCQLVIIGNVTQHEAQVAIMFMITTTHSSNHDLKTC